MGQEHGDRWADWLLERRHGGDEMALRRALSFLEPIRDRVIAAAEIGPGSMVVDVGCGDGLLGFAAAGLVGESGRVSFLDISPELLDRCRQIASELDLSDRCRFVQGSAESLDEIGDESVDAVLTRSVLIYVDDKAGTFEEFHRVLKPGGRISLFEPINSRIVALNQDLLFGYDVGPVSELADKIRQVYDAANPANGPMLNFDETDLLSLAEEAGFVEAYVTLELASTNRTPHAGLSWTSLMRTSPNPNAPTYGDAIRRALSREEASRLEDYLRPMIESGAPGRMRKAGAFITAKRAG